MNYLIKIVTLLALLYPIVAATQNTDGTVTPIDKVNLNRKALKILSSYHKQYPKYQSGFQWNDEDEKTLKWRPQGITSMQIKNSNGEEKKYLLVSWYGLKKAKPTYRLHSTVNYHKRGARVSLVDVTNMKKIKYRHILLVGEDLTPITSLHAGGLVQKGRMLYTVDSRKDNYAVLVFNLDEIREVDPKKYKNYRYILIQKNKHTVDFKPAFIGYDNTNHKMLIGSFAHKSASKNTKKLAWYAGINFPLTTTVYDGLYSEMQGAVSGQNPKNKKKVLWISCSYGRDNNSRLHAMYYQLDSSNKTITLTNKTKWHYPPGLEDLHINPKTNRMWLLTEFGNDEQDPNVFTKNSRNMRAVFSVHTSSIMPKD